MRHFTFRIDNHPLAGTLLVTVYHIEFKTHPCLFWCWGMTIQCQNCAYNQLIAILIGIFNLTNHVTIDLANDIKNKSNIRLNARRASFLERRGSIDVGPLLGTWTSNRAFEAPMVELRFCLSLRFYALFFHGQPNLQCRIEIEMWRGQPKQVYDACIKCQ